MNKNVNNPSENGSPGGLNLDVDAFKYPLHPKFGTFFAPVLLSAELERGKPLPKFEIGEFSNLSLSPATAALHYGQSIFEGMKAFSQPDQNVAVFRLDRHARRFVNSAKKMGMVEISETFFCDCILEFVRSAKRFVPQEEDHSLYLRPIMFAADPVIKVGVSQKFLFLIMGAVAGDYFRSGPTRAAAKVMVHRKFVRAFPNGYGEVKTAANYALSLGPQAYAAQSGCDQVLYLDSHEHTNIDELGGMNFFVIKGSQLITPALNGCILDGITRRSLLEIAPKLNLTPIETKLSIFDVIDDIKNGAIQEVFACGTAALVSPIGELLFKESDDDPGQLLSLKQPMPVTQSLRDELIKIQRGIIAPPGKWLFSI